MLRDAGVGLEKDVPVPADEVDDVALLEADTAGLLGFTRVIARTRPTAADA